MREMRRKEDRMENMISIIIPEAEDHTYLIRCIHSIRRQTWKKIQILLAGAYDKQELLQEEYLICPNGIGEAVERAEGEYLFFCSITSVMTENTLEALMKAAENPEVCTMGGCYIPDGKNFRQEPEADRSIYGKLFSKKLLAKNGIPYEETMHYAEELFTFRYRNLFGSLKKDETVYIYETDAGVFHRAAPEELTDQETDALLALYGSLSETMRPEYLNFLSGITQECIGIRNPYYLVLRISKQFHDQYQWNARIARSYVKSWYETFLQDEDPVKYEQVKNYLLLYEGEEDYRKVILDACGLNEELFEYLKKYDAREYLFYRETLPAITRKEAAIREGREDGWIREEGKETKEKLLAMAEVMKDMNQRLAGMEKGIKAGGGSKEIGTRLDALTGMMGSLSQRFAGMEERIKAADSSEPPIVIQGGYDMLNGPALADFVVEKYQTGNLGLKTIWKSFLAWLKYKL